VQVAPAAQAGAIASAIDPRWLPTHGPQFPFYPRLP